MGHSLCTSWSPSFRAQIVYPKVHLFVWNSDDTNRQFYDPPESSELTDTQAAFLSVFKTYWTRYGAALDRVCVAVLDGEKGEKGGAGSTARRNNGQHCTATMLDGLDHGDLAGWCRATESEGNGTRILFEREAPSIHALEADNRVPLWQHTLGEGGQE